MRKLHGHRRSLTWLCSLASAIAIASFGANVVLAEDTGCIDHDGNPVAQSDADANPELCFTPPEPEPTPPTPEPTTPEPPVDPVTTPPADDDSNHPVTPPPAPPTPDPPTPDPVAPAPAPDPAAPAPTTPDPVAPAPTPDPATPPNDPTGTTDTTGTSTGSSTEDDTTQPTPPTVQRPIRTVKPAPPATDTHRFLTAKQYQAAPFRDARLFREQFTPKGRIPEQPNLSQDQADVLIDAAAGTGVDWSTLAAIAWLDSRWGDPSAGMLLGARLTDAAWATHGTDGDEDGKVDRANPADQAATTARFLADARSTPAAALLAYFGGVNQRPLTRRAKFLSDYFDALGRDAVVTGLEDAATREALQERLLANEDIELYDGGRADVQAGLVDPRIIVTLEFLQNRFGTVTISSLISGHGVYTAGGNVSLHSYGQAVDIAALGGESILGHQGKGGRTYRAVRELLLLPEAIQSAELITLWDMGMPSFAAADHHDHIHIGFKTVDEGAADDSAGTFGE